MPRLSRHERIARWLHGKGDRCQCCQREILTGECYPFNPDEAINMALAPYPGNPEGRPGLIKALAHPHSVSLCRRCHDDALGTYFKSGWRMQIHDGTVVWVKYPHPPREGGEVPGLQPGGGLLHPRGQLEQGKAGGVQG